MLGLGLAMLALIVRTVTALAGLKVLNRSQIVKSAGPACAQQAIAECAIEDAPRLSDCK